MKISITVEITKSKHDIRQLSRRLHRLEKEALTEDKLVKELEEHLPDLKTSPDSESCKNEPPQMNDVIDQWRQAVREHSSRLYDTQKVP